MHRLVQRGLSMTRSAWIRETRLCHSSGHLGRDPQAAEAVPSSISKGRPLTRMRQAQRARALVAGCGCGVVARQLLQNAEALGLKLFHAPRANTRRDGNRHGIHLPICRYLIRRELIAGVGAPSVRVHAGQLLHAGSGLAFQPLFSYGWVMMRRSLCSVSTIGSFFPALSTPIAWNT